MYGSIASSRQRRKERSEQIHGITLRYLIEKVWDTPGAEAFCCFVDFRKAFDTVPRNKLWDRMEELEVPKELRSAVYRLYQQVKAKIRTTEGLSEDFDSNIGVKQGCPLSPTLFGLYIDKLEEWINKTNGEGVQLAHFVIRLLLYADDLIILARTAKGLKEHLKALESFCHEVGMQVNTSKTKVMIFSLKKNRGIQDEFMFESSPLEIVEEYKYLGIDFHNKLNWDTCRSKRIQGGWKALYSLQNKCRNAELWDWATMKTLFGVLVTPVILYGCEVWGGSMTKQKWRQVERIQKHFITCNLRVKTTVPYEILLAEVGSFPLEAAALTQMLSYLKKTQGLETHRWPKLVIEEKLVRRKSTWMKQNDKWMQKWDINIQACPDNSKEIKKFVNEKFRNIMWTRHMGRKKSYYIKEFNPTSSHDEKAYIRAPIDWKAKMLMAQLRTSSHQLRCETGRWQVPKEEWADRTCLFCNMGKVETEQHFVKECLAYNDIRSGYTEILQNKDFNYLFKEDQVNRTAALIIKLQRRRDKLSKTLQLTSFTPGSGG